MKENVLINSRSKTFSSYEQLINTPLHDLAALNIITRDKSLVENDFFLQFAEQDIKLSCLVKTKSLIQDIDNQLKQTLPNRALEHNFYPFWLNDIAEAIDFFATFTKKDSIILWLTSKRVCQNFHVDKTKWRLLKTYYGEGTEWTPETIFEIKNKDEIKPNKVKSWQTCLMQGGNNGIVHRSPTIESAWTLLMRLDLPEFNSNCR